MEARVDKGQIAQVFSNLASNAGQAMASDDQLQVLWFPGFHVKAVPAWALHEEIKRVLAEPAGD